MLADKYRTDGRKISTHTAHYVICQKEFNGIQSVVYGYKFAILGSKIEICSQSSW